MSEVGDRYGRLTVVGFRKSTRGRRARCVCSCGSKFELAESALGVRMFSCGCLRRAPTEAAIQEVMKLKASGVSLQKVIAIWRKTKI